MRAHDGDLRHIVETLRAGRLDEARALAFLLPPSPATRELENATSLEAALRASARVAGACADCHARWSVRAPFERETIPPRDPIARHRWGADRLCDGVLGNSEPQWRAGLTVFAAEHDKAAERALAYWGDRAVVYGELLVGCTRCHALRRGRSDRGEGASARTP